MASTQSKLSKPYASENVAKPQQRRGDIVDSLLKSDKNFRILCTLENCLCGEGLLQRESDAKSLGLAFAHISERKGCDRFINEV